jgi:cytidine deaminase
VAIRTGSGRVFRGSYIENAAFNPSLSPLQTALVALLAAGEKFESISRVLLVETHAGISQRSVTEAALQTVAPAVRLEVLTAAPA